MAEGHPDRMHLRSRLLVRTQSDAEPVVPPVLRPVWALACERRDTLPNQHCAGLYRVSGVFWDSTPDIRSLDNGAEPWYPPLRGTTREDRFAVDGYRVRHIINR